MNIPETEGVCICGHWYDEHVAGGLCDTCDTMGESTDVRCSQFRLSAELSHPDMIADRGGDPESWPQYVKDYFGPLETGPRFTGTITFTGKTLSDVEDAIQEGLRLVSEGFTSGGGQNEDGSVTIDVTDHNPYGDDDG